MSFHLALETHLQAHPCQKYLHNFSGQDKCLKRDRKIKMHFREGGFKPDIFGGVKMFGGFVGTQYSENTWWDDMHRKERGRSFPVRQKAARNSLWKPLWRQIRFRNVWPHCGRQPKLTHEAYMFNCPKAQKPKVFVNVDERKEHGRTDARNTI